MNGCMNGGFVGLDTAASHGRLHARPRCNADLGLASAVFSHVWPSTVAQVTAVEFEHSPGRK